MKKETKMFELNPELEITAIRDIGPDDRSALVIDNFYENPDEVRDLAIKLPRVNDLPFVNHHSGTRAAYQTSEVRKNLEHIFTLKYVLIRNTGVEKLICNKLRLAWRECGFWLTT